MARTKTKPPEKAAKNGEAPVRDVQLEPHQATEMNAAVRRTLAAQREHQAAIAHQQSLVRLLGFDPTDPGLGYNVDTGIFKVPVRD